MGAPKPGSAERMNAQGFRKRNGEPFETEVERARIRLEWAEQNPHGCADFDHCGVCQSGIQAAKREYEALLAGGSE